MQQESFVTPNAFRGSDVERINQAVQAGARDGLRVVIPRRNTSADGKRDVWLLDSAILVQSNTVLELDNCHIKLSDRCRDNMIRSANCGLDITDIHPMHHIHIYGVGNVVLEGADRPRATGDSAKTLGKRTYGTDAGVEGQSQTGDWRNIGVLLASVEHFRIENLHIKDSHCWAISQEQCSRGFLHDIVFDTHVKNGDGIDFRNGCSLCFVDSISGTTSDDMVACTALNGSYMSPDSKYIYPMQPMGLTRAGDSGDIHDIVIRNIRKRGKHHAVICLATSPSVYNITIEEQLVPLSATTTYSHKERLALDGTKHVWEASATAL